MLSALLWRSTLAISLSLAFGLLTLRIINSADGGSSSLAQNQDHFPARLSLVRQASNGQLISLQISPFEVGLNAFRVTMLNPVGQTQELGNARLKISRLESSDVPTEVGSTTSGRSRESSGILPAPGWWQIDVLANDAAKATFYLKLDQPSSAPTAFVPPNYVSDPEAQRLFELALTRYQSLTGLETREELTSGYPGPVGFGVWYLSDIALNRQGLHATTLGMGEGGSELYSGPDRQCVRQAREAWSCSPGAAPLGPLELGYLRSATGFALGREELVNAELTQIVFFYNPPQGAWYTWWIGEKTNNVLRQAMVANGHFMLGRNSNHDAPVAIQPKDLPVQ